MCETTPDLTHLTPPSSSSFVIFSSSSCSPTPPHLISLPPHGATPERREETLINVTPSSPGFHSPPLEIESRKEAAAPLVILLHLVERESGTMWNQSGYCNHILHAGYPFYHAPCRYDTATPPQGFHSSPEIFTRSGNFWTLRPDRFSHFCISENY